MRLLKIVIGVLLCVAGGYIILLELAMAVSESDLLHDTGAVICISLFLLLGVVLIVMGVKLVLPKLTFTRKDKTTGWGPP